MNNLFLSRARNHESQPCLQCPKEEFLVTLLPIQSFLVWTAERSVSLSTDSRFLSEVLEFSQSQDRVKELKRTEEGNERENGRQVCGC